MKKYIFYFLPLIALASCTASDVTGEKREPVIVGDQEIVLTSGIGEQPVKETRAVINNTLAADLDVAIIRLDETGDPKSIPVWTDVTPNDVLAATVGKTSKVVTFKKSMTEPDTIAQYYQANGDKTRLLGFYPREGQVASGVITWEIDGAKDIMVSNSQDGDKTAKFGASKQLTFEHLLTQIVVKAYADSVTSFNNWGKIKKVSLKDQNLICKYTLKNNAADGSIGGTTAFDMKDGAKKYLEIIKKNTNDSILKPNDYGADGLEYYYGKDTSKATVCGYAMFQPAAANSLTLVIETAKGGTIEKTLTQELKQGYAYNVVLKFTSQEIIPVVAISEWKTGGDIEVVL